MRDVILNLLEKNGDLPFLPDMVQKLEKKLNDPKSHISDIANIIDLDPTLAGKILTLSNSVYYNRSQKKIKTVKSAISSVGLKEIVKLVYSLELSKLFVDNAVLDPKRFWIHSLAVATLTQTFGRLIKADKELQDLAYLAGLMHDIGIMVFCYLIPENYAALLKNVSSSGKTLETLEKDTFGIDHAELGALFIEKWWNLDARIAYSIFYHHSPEIESSENNRKSSQLLNITNGICKKHGYDNGIDSKTSELDDRVLAQLGLTVEEIDGLIGEIKESLHQAEKLLH